MNIIRLLTFFVFTISLLSNTSCFSSPIIHLDTFPKTNSTLPESYLIEGVPYISQETNFFCGYATNTMIFNNYGLNTTLHEVVYNSGVGYSLIYPNFKYNSLPHDAFLICQGTLTNNFLSDIYGLSYDPWIVESSLPDDEQWYENWINIKHNISNNIPISIQVDENILFADNLGFGVFYPLIKSIPLNNSHLILLLGFNEDNKTVCYSDPLYGIFNKSQYGTYRWIDLTRFKTSISRISERAWFKLFKDIPKAPLSKEEAFKISHERNIEKLKGNFSLYFKEYSEFEFDQNFSYGINAVKRLKGDLEKGTDYRIKTLYKYKLNNGMGIMYRLMSRSYFPKLSPLSIEELFLDFNDVYGNIAIEKKYTADYLYQIQNLLTDDNLSNICKHEALLFKKEAENWTQLADYYSIFRKIGIFMPLPIGLLIMNKMVDVFDNIIAIQEAIITGFSEN